MPWRLEVLFEVRNPGYLHDMLRMVHLWNRNAFSRYVWHSRRSIPNVQAKTLHLGSVGTVELGVQSIIIQVLSFCFMVSVYIREIEYFLDLKQFFDSTEIPNGIGVAGNILVGHLLGMNKPAEALNAYRVIVTFSSNYSSVPRSRVDTKSQLKF